MTQNAAAAVPVEPVVVQVNVVPDTTADVVYLATAQPPEAPGTHVTRSLLGPAIAAATPLGASGAPHGVAATDTDEAPCPTALSAATVTR